MRQRIRLRCWWSGGRRVIRRGLRRAFILLRGRRRRGRVCIRTNISIVCFWLFVFSLLLFAVQSSWIVLTGSIDMGSKGEVRINQAKRGYDVTEDEQGLIWLNP